ncbi:MAG: N-acetylmuramoyl-L-alanine amidase [Ruminococcaceae bacterium]|nr:N-acetylmuramoyl-L-alanine amidase [Oscillospiraceae bacterium]
MLQRYLYLLMLLARLLSLYAPAPADAAAEDADDAPVQTEQEALARDEAERLPLSGHIICVDPGHCVTPLTGKGYTELVSPLSDQRKALYTTGTQGKHLTEEKLNLILGLKLRDRLEELGATVVMTREVSEITISGIERCEIAHEANAEVSIHIHADGNADRRVHGVSVFVPAGDLLGTPEIKDESVRLGELMVNAVAAETGAKNLGTVKRTDLTNFNFSKIPTVLIETGFMTNPEEDAKLETEEYQDKIVTGMVASILAWYGVG